MEALSLILLLAFLLSIPNICLGKDLITKTQFLRDGDTIVSEGGTFVMGFFNPTNSLNHYIGIWYRKDPDKTVVWVANRDAPLANTSSAVLKINLGGQLALLGDKGQPVWSANTSRSVPNPVAELLDTGNLVVRDADDEKMQNILWQSIDHPTDHWLSGMKFGWNLQTGDEVFITSWKGENDPASGQYTLHLDPTGYPQFSLKNRTTEIFNTGPWNGLRFSVAPVEQSTNNHGYYGLVRNKKEVYIRYDISNEFGLFRFVVTSNGIIKTWVWEDELKQWVSFFSEPADICGTYGLCGGNGVCSIHDYHSCGCLPKFLPNNNATDSLSLGCHRRKPLNCHNNGSSSDGFLKYSDIKLPDTKHSWFNESMSLQECEQVCLRNCSCMAYSTLDISNGGSGCLIWYEDLVDMRSIQNGQDIYIRLAATEIPGLPGLTPESHHSSSMGRKLKVLVLCLSMLVVIVLAGVSLFLYFYKTKKKEKNLKQELELPVFDWSTISRATNNFSETNKLGEGGFGAVYKGTLDGGEEIAVKRLSKNSAQGLEEFMNEVICIAKLQHRNLVKLLGCCIRGEEKMLIYEYMPNKSLDFFIFDQTKKRLLDWPKRFNIINGVARGLLYLHQDSRLRIIHRDLKASNVLLDADLNPKISDFGLARSILGNATGYNTKRVAGTRGYMAPEYAGHGIFSVKSDVFSFGILVLEIVSGKRNTEYINEDQYVALPEHAWKLYREGKSIALVDEYIVDSYDVVQVLRSIHVALLCVQQSPKDRPDMSSVVQMLVNDYALPQAKEPDFFFGKEYSSSTHAKGSQNEVTITTLNPRTAFTHSLACLIFILGCCTVEISLPLTLSVAMEALLLILLLAFLLSIPNICLGKDLITKTQFLRDGDTMVSEGGTFVMGFFSPTNSINRFIGIWYKQDPVKTVVWVANRDAPLADTSSAVLKINLGGQLSLLGDNDEAVWFANTSRSSVPNPVAELLDTGNLVVRDADDEKLQNFVWQSFDHPTDHWISGMKLGWNLQTGHEVFITSWKGENDPASGQYTLHLDPTGYPQLSLKNRTTEIFNSGPWNGLRLSAAPVEQSNTNIGPYGLVRNKKEVYGWYNITSIYSGLFRFRVTSNGIVKTWVWEDELKQWVSFFSEPADICGTYGLCGGNGVCNIPHEYYHSCGCLPKFLPNNNATESLSLGCHRRKPLNCHNNGSSSDGFLKYSDIKLPDTKHSWFNESMSLQECERVCLRNCSCMAYSTLNISNGGSGCLIWYDDLVDIRTIPNGQDIYIRLAATEIPLPGLTPEPHHSSSLLGRKIKILVLCLSMLVVIVLAGVSLYLCFCKSKRKEQKLKQELELPVFDWSTISKATNNFSEMNKLGQGGFGVVYKGALDGGEEIAVKRLSKNSAQGLEEFMNEVICIAKLQHRNLVKLLGCCISGEENMLIYEYMPNKSLDFFIFDPTKKRLLDWPKRFNIINGVARGLLYLHQDSRLRIIHRDLKASNILLDADLNPKISDFGLARSILGNATGDNTKRVAGTRGYMSPEYAGHGIFSVKSDVFSFGISVLEIVSGRKNSEFINEDQYVALPEHAWKLYREGKSIAMVDEHIAGSYDVVQVLRSIHVALLCVQQSPEDRPDMSTVVQMLVNDFALPQAKEPGFFFGKEYSSSTHVKCSQNEVTITTLNPRC
ncbi:PREDICTED: uncharacterized protein LOC109149199 [Ipomoea nil]|uniref:uncharacterized protein LOC109149199 n=1 Tax=Ipomoea nil TaxID=35883 RepID=UPI000901C190|nr:PREDICTED: uncharacterized protein LOC109149199 [Ipomoea nil]